MTPGIEHFVFNAQRDRRRPSRGPGRRSEQRPYGLPRSILSSDRSNSRTVSKGTRTVPKPSEAMPRIRRQEGETLIVLGPGAVRDLRQLLRELGSTRPYLVTGAHLAGGPVGARVREALGDGLVGTYSRSQPHVPEATAEEVAGEARSRKAVAVVGLGGGGVIGSARAAAYSLHSSSGVSRGRA